MAGETLRTASELLAAYADNVSGLITALTGRDFVVSVTPAVGFVEDDPATVPYVIPMTDGVAVPFIPTLTTPLFVGNFYKLDPSGIVPAYADFGVSVPPGTQRMNSASVLLNCQKLGGGTADYLFQGTEGGALTGEPVTRTIGITPATQVFSGTRLYDVSIGGVLDFNITPLGHSDDLQINDVRISVEGVML